MATQRIQTADIAEARATVRANGVTAFDARALPGRLLLQICDGTVSASNARDAVEIATMLGGRKSSATKSSDEAQRTGAIDQLVVAMTDQARHQGRARTALAGLKDGFDRMFGGAQLSRERATALDVARDLKDAGQLSGAQYQRVRDAVLDDKVTPSLVTEIGRISLHLAEPLRSINERRFGGGGPSWLLGP